jgi:hypothetical protein
MQLDLFTTRWFWSGWWEMLSTVLPFPQHQRALALVPLAPAIAGFAAGGRKPPRPILVGLAVG